MTARVVKTEPTRSRLLETPSLGRTAPPRKPSSLSIAMDSSQALQGWRPSSGMSFPAPPPSGDFRTARSRSRSRSLRRASRAAQVALQQENEQLRGSLAQVREDTIARRLTQLAARADRAEAAAATSLQLVRDLSVELAAAKKVIATIAASSDRDARRLDRHNAVHGDIDTRVSRLESGMGGIQVVLDGIEDHLKKGNKGKGKGKDKDGKSKDKSKETHARVMTRLPSTPLGANPGSPLAPRGQSPAASRAGAPARMRATSPSDPRLQQSGALEGEDGIGEVTRAADAAVSQLRLRSNTIQTEMDIFDAEGSGRSTRHKRRSASPSRSQRR